MRVSNGGRSVLRLALGVLSVVSFGAGSLRAANDGIEADLTNVQQIATIFASPPGCFPSVMPLVTAPTNSFPQWWVHTGNPLWKIDRGIPTWYADFSRLPTNLTVIQSYQWTTNQYGARIYPVRIVQYLQTTQDVQAGEVEALSPVNGNELLDVRTSLFPTDSLYNEVLWEWTALGIFSSPQTFGQLVEQYPDLAPKRLVFDVWLADVRSKPAPPNPPVHQNDDPLPLDDPFDPPCGGLAYNKLQASGTNFVLQWFSFTNATYEIVSTVSLTSPNWLTLASQYPAAAGTNLTNFTDFGGATNATKFYKVARTGITIALCDSNTYSGTVNIPVQIGIPTGQILSALSFVVDGVGSRAMTDPQPPFTSQPFGVFDTTLITNGWHTIQAVAEYPSSQYDGGYAVYTSQTVIVQSLNHITFPDMLFTLNNGLHIQATLDILITNWTVTILSPSNQTLRVYSGITSNGHIDVFWDGKDTNGVQFSGPFVDFVVNDPAKKRPYYEAAMAGFPQNFLVSYQLLFTDGSTSALQFENMISQIALAIGNDGGVNYNLQGDGTGVDSTTKIDDTASSWRSWANSLASNSCANLFYFGHGGADCVGLRTSNTNSGFFVSELNNLLGNSITNGSPHFQQPFHFVFLDGCNTGSGHLCEAFGIERFATTSKDYVTNGLVARAFVGWPDTKDYGFGNLWSAQHGNFITSFFNDWQLNNVGLQNALTRNLPPGRGFSPPQVWGATDLTWVP